MTGPPASSAATPWRHASRTPPRCSMPASWPAARPEHCVYVGDAERDVEAGRNAGMHTLVALFGYFQAHDRPHEWHADGMIQAPPDLLAWLTRLNGSG